MYRRALTLACGALTLVSALSAAAPTAPEWNPLRRAPVTLGAESHRIIVGFRATLANTRVQTIAPRVGRPPMHVAEAQTSSDDVDSLVRRTGLGVAKSRQITASMHVMFLAQTLYGAGLESALAALRRDPAVSFAEVDQRRYPHAVPTPDDPLFQPATGVSSGQWYLLAPNPAITVEGVATQDLAAADAQDAWVLTTGSSAIVIADVDTGVLFDHPDLMRANRGGRMLPGYDFIGEDYDPKNGTALGTYLAANDGDGWDPDPSDPGDWVSSTDFQFKDSQGNNLFPDSSCGQLDPTTNTYQPVSSSWHGTRVVGIFGALTNNGVGIAGLTWGSASSPGPWVLPVRALGKCGGYDSDIIAGIYWAAGLSATTGTSSTATVPRNPFPADIINLSLGGPNLSGRQCNNQENKGYIDALNAVTQVGVLVVVSAGNGGTSGALAPVEVPASCSAQVPGVIAVAGLRNVGTKVGYSSFGPEVGVSAPAGNCINTSPGANCLRSIDTTTNDGNTGPDAGGYGYTNEQNPNLGTSFSAPMVSGIAALMRSVNANLTPAQLVARLESSAAAFPSGAAGLPVCPLTDSTTGECACPTPGGGITLGGNSQCGAGMVNALSAVRAALQPIGVIATPAAFGASVVFDASASVASCGNSIATYAWTADTPNLIPGAANGPKVTVVPGAIATGSQGTLTLTLTDSAGNVDVETVVLSASALVSSTAPTSAGSASTACPAPLATNPAAPAAPTVAAAWSPASVGPNTASTLTLTIGNANGFALTQASLDVALPSGLSLASAGKASTTCTGAARALASSATAVSLAGGVVPAGGSCTLTIPLQAASAGNYAVTIAAGDLITGPAGASNATTTATLTVTQPSSGGGGGGQVDWPELLIAASGLVLLRRRRDRAR